MLAAAIDKEEEHIWWNVYTVTKSISLLKDARLQIKQLVGVEEKTGCCIKLESCWSLHFANAETQFVRADWGRGGCIDR